MGTVKYSGPMASFHCPTNAEIRSLKVHFSPKQEGSGDPSPENVREIVGWDGVEVYSYPDVNISIDNIPNEYKKINYLQSSGTQYIDTLVSGGNSTTHPKYEIIFAPINSTQTFQQYFAGERAPQGIPKLYKDGNRSACVVQKAGIGTKDCNIAYNEISKIVVSEDLCEVNGIDIEFDSSEALNGWGSSSWYIFNSHAEPTLASNMRLYGLKMWSNESLIRNFIPCRRKSDDKPGMYDTVSQTFFTNQGTGEFICGSDVGETVEYEFGVLGKNKINLSVPNVENEYFALNTKNIGYTYAVKLNQWRNGANYISDLSITENSISFTTGAANAYGVMYCLHLIPDVTYTCNAIITNGRIKAEFWQKNKTYISGILGEDDSNLTFTVPANAYYSLLYFVPSQTNISASFSNIQLELGSTATTYEPYDPNHTVYGGWVDLITGEVREEWGEYIFTGDEDIKVGSWNTGGYTDGQFYRLTYSNGADGNPFCSTTTSEETKCNILKPVASSYYGVKAGNISVLGKNDGVVYRYIVWGKSGFGDTAEDCVSKLRELYNNGTPLTVVSKLANPYINTYHLAPTQLQTFLSHNNIWSNADYVEVEYDLHETQNILARKQFIMANQPHIVKPAAAPLQNFVTDMVAPLKECKVHFSPVQEGEGDPSPENVRPISGWTGVKLFRAGKNLISDNHTLVGAQFKNVDGNYEIGTANIYEILSIDVPKNTSLHIHKEIAAGSELGLGNEIAYYGAPAVRIGSMTNYYNRDFNTGNYPYAYLMIGKDSTINDSDKQWQIEVGNVATTYEASKGTIDTAFDWSSAGTIYGGYVDLVTGEVVQEWYTISIDETTSMRIYAPDARNQGTYCEASYWLSTFNAPKAASYEPYSTDGYCNILPYIENNYTNEARACAYNSVADIYLSGVKTQEEYLAWIAEYGPIIICYRLATPIHYTLTPIQLKTLRGTNNVWSNAGDITLSYWKH